MKIEIYRCDLCNKDFDKILSNGPVEVTIVTNFPYEIFKILEHAHQHICGECLVKLFDQISSAVINFEKQIK